jgi:hypothetical protein
MSDASRPRLEPLLVVSAFLVLTILATYPLIRHLVDVRRRSEIVRLGRPRQSNVGSALAIDDALERQLFPGLTVVMLSAIAVWPGAGRRPRTLLYAAIAVIFFVLSLGPEPSVWSHRLFRWGPYLWLTWIVPGFDAIRAPARLATGVYLSLSVLAAFGVTRILATASPRKRAGAAVAIGAALVVEGWAAPIPLAAFDPRGRPPDRLLQAVGLRYVIVHPGDYEERDRGVQTIAAIRTSTPHVAEEQIFPGGLLSG